MTVSTEHRDHISAAEFAAIHAVTPFICVPDGDKLIEFMKHTFGAEETSRHPHGPDGFVAGVRIGDSDLLIMGGESLRGQECSCRVTRVCEGLRRHLPTRARGGSLYHRLRVSASPPTGPMANAPHLSRTPSVTTGSLRPASAPTMSVWV